MLARHAQPAGSGSPFLAYFKRLTKYKERETISPSDFSLSWWTTSWPRALTSRKNAVTQCCSSVTAAAEAGSGLDDITGPLSLPMLSYAGRMDVRSRDRVPSRGSAPERRLRHSFCLDPAESAIVLALPPPRPIRLGKVTAARAAAAISAPQEARAALGKVSRRRGT